ncbi:MAG: type II toxin-antitoxin system HicB family antitoxin [Candidatus Micrarchaeota archaeon]
MKEEIQVEGYKVIVEEAEDAKGVFIASVPKLPGCIIQASKREDVETEITHAIGLYLLGLAELAKKRPKIRPSNDQPGNGDSKRKARIKG